MESQTPSFCSLLEFSLRQRLLSSIERLDRVQASHISKQLHLTQVHEHPTFYGTNRTDTTQLSYDLEDASEAVKDAKKDVFLDVLRYGHLTCRHLCDTMQTKLPRELRDMIYRHVSTHRYCMVNDFSCSDSSSSLRVPPQNNWVLGTDGPNHQFHKGWQPYKDPPRDVRKPHYWDPLWVGWPTCLELVENWGRTSRFSFDVTDCTSRALEFLSCDFFNSKYLVPGAGMDNAIVTPGDYINSIEIKTKEVLPVEKGQRDSFLASLKHIRSGMHVLFVPWKRTSLGELTGTISRPAEQYVEAVESWWPVWQTLVEKGCKLSVEMGTLCSTLWLVLDSEKMEFSKEKWLERAAACTEELTI